ncbi:Alpha/Beta hydrolase protein [Mycena maculata]|uniref:Carboxylic ester hydrolase n=1 Tax=Mycena maculata TaxID=230809 RepID=A0AAD7HEY6_9AGAR|nr:Alpha/Beta hydrolase protein [Mycena maculata]
MPQNSGPLVPSSLSINVFKPIASTNGSKLPVFVYLENPNSRSLGGFEVGDSSDIDVSPVVERSMETGQPVIVVTPNYRLSEIFALQWVQQHITAFGGDPDRVVLGGQSSGAISTAHLLSNKLNSNTLFRGAFMQAGSQLAGRTVADGQSDYDGLVAANNCTGSSDTLDCLRRVPFEAFWATVNNTVNILSYRSLSLIWRPRVDGDVIAIDPLAPFMTGDYDDEGTIFSVAPSNTYRGAQFLGRSVGSLE